jgi:hypothetical protein
LQFQERENVIKTETKKILNYKEPKIGIQHMWTVKLEVIPAIIEATENISRSFRKYLGNVPKKHDIKELQKTTTLNTNVKVLRIVTGKNST